MKAILRFFMRWGAAFLSDTRAATAAVMAVTIATLIGLSGLGVETGLWFTEKRDYQTAADSAAISGVFLLASEETACMGGSATASASAIGEAGDLMAGKNGYSGSYTLNPTNYKTLAAAYDSGGGLFVNYPPKFGPYANNPCAVEAIISQPKNAMLASLYRSSVIIGVRAVALIDSYGGGICALSLYNGSNPPGNGNNIGINVNGGVDLNQPDCMIASDNTSIPSNQTECGVTVGGGTGTSVTVASVYTAGDACFNGNPPNIQAGLTNAAGGSPIPDPFASSFPENPSMPSAANCPGATSVSNPTNTTLSPGTYSSISLTDGRSYTLDSGTYYICSSNNGNGAGMFTATASTGNSTTVNSGSDGVTIIAQNGFNISAQGKLEASDSSGTYPGFLFYQPGTATGNMPSSNVGAANGLTLTLNGYVYLPGGVMNFGGSGTTTADSCLEIVAALIDFQGNAYLTNTGCGNSQSFIVANASLVE